MKPVFVDLTSHANAHAATFDEDRSAGFVNAWGNSFPAEEIPFGRMLLVGGIPYNLPLKCSGSPDHAEALGQCIDSGTLAAVCAVGVLGFGELGTQRLAIVLHDRLGNERRVSVSLPNWLVPKNEPVARGVWRASHLHYAAGYELEQLCPLTGSELVRLPTVFQPVSLTLLPNPLAHVFSVTLVCQETSRA